MKRIIAFCLAICLLLGLAGCVSQQEADQLSAQINQLQEELASAKKQLADVKKDLANAEKSFKKDKAALEKEKASLSKELEQALNTISGLEAQVDELKNGPDRMLAQIRTAYDKKDWKSVVSLAKTLHSKYPGLDQDVEGQDLSKKAQQKIDEEKAKAEAEAAKTAKEKVRGLIRITKLSCSKPNSAGGVGINLYFVNKHPTKTIKYLYVSVYPYNKVGDMMDCDIRGYSRYTCEATGPFKPGKGINSSSNWWWPNAWYNWNITKIELSGVRIVYTDGTSVTLSSSELKYAIW